VLGAFAYYEPIKPPTRVRWGTEGGGRQSQIAGLCALSVAPETAMTAHTLQQPSIIPGLTILVVEDERIVRDAIAEYLRDAGCYVLEAESAETAISQFVDYAHIDVVFTDIELGGPLNGWDVGEAFRGANSDVAVIYASGCYSDHRRPVTGSRAFDKPYVPGAVLDACRGLCNGVH
jgi:two-component system, response regulator PdtaR